MFKRDGTKAGQVSPSPKNLYGWNPAMMRAQERAPFVKLSKSYFSLGEWI